MKRRLLAIFIVVLSVVLLMVLLPSCKAAGTTGEETTAGETTAVAEKPVYGGILKYALTGEPTMLDPHLNAATLDRMLSDLVHSYLWQQNKERTGYNPRLAESWKWEDDLTLKIKLVEGALFTNGREVVADDVKFSLERILNPDTGSPRMSLYQSINNIEVIDKYNLIIHLSTYNPGLEASLSRESIIPKETVDTIKNAPFGCGPWILKSWEKGVKLVFEKNPNYYRKGLPYSDGFEVRFMPEYTTEKAALLNGEIDIIDWPEVSDLESLKSTKGIKLNTETATQEAVMNITFNTTKEFLDNAKLRKAIALALNRDEFIKLYSAGIGVPMVVPIPTTDPFYNANWEYSQNLEEAKKLLAEAYPNGIDKTFEITVYNSPEIKLAEVFQSQMQQLGIKVTINVVDLATLIDNVLTKQNFEIAEVGDFWVPGDPNFFITNWFLKGGSINGALGGWQNAEVTRLAAEALKPHTLEERKEIYNQLYKIILDENPLISLCSDAKIAAMRENVMDFVKYGVETINFEEIWIK